MHGEPATAAGAATAAAPQEPGRSVLLLTLVLAACAFAVVLAGTRSTLFDLDRHAVPKELAMHITALFAAAWLLCEWRTVRAGIVELPLAIFIGWSALSALLATNHWLALRAFGLSFSAFILFLAARRTAGRPAASVLTGALALAATVGAAIGSAQAYGLELAVLASERAPGGTFGNRNFLAHLVTLAVPLVILRVLRVRHAWQAGAWAVALAVCTNAIVLTRSRAAWLGLIAAFGVLGIMHLLARPAVRAQTAALRPRLIAAGLLIGVLTAVFLPNELQWRADSPYTETLTRLADYRSGSGRGRIVQYRNSLALVAMDPVFGTGPGNWFIKYPLVTKPPDPSYNPADPIPTNPWPSSDWIALLTERGALALVLVLLTGGSILAICLRRARGDDPAAALNASAAAAILAAVTVTGAFDAVLLNAAPACFTALSLGALLPRTRTIVDRPIEGRARRAVIIASITLLTTCTVYSGVQLAAIRLTRDSQTRAALARAVRIDPTSHRLHLHLARRGPCSERIPHARAAARLMPHHESPRKTLAACRSG